MLSYEALDSVADAVNPTLGVIWLIFVTVSFFRKQARAAMLQLSLGISTLAVAYGLMWLDNQLGAFRFLGLDYSTHTAVSAALALTLLLSWRWATLIAPVVLLSYIALMLYQQYHSAADIAATLALLAAPFGGLSLLVYRARYLESMR